MLIASHPRSVEGGPGWGESSKLAGVWRGDSLRAHVARVPSDDHWVGSSMDVALVVALIAGAFGLFGTTLSLRAQRATAREERRFTKQDALDRLLRTYRDPLAHAAFDLQSRLFNIGRGYFLQRYCTEGDEAERRYAVTSTLWLVGQYLAWVEILRRRIQFLDLGALEQDRRLRDLLLAVRRAFQDDSRSMGMRLFAAQQRAIGELMMVQAWGAEEVVGDCLGYAEFARRLDAELSPWFDDLRRDVERMAQEDLPHPRILALQEALVSLVRFLDPDGVRFPEEELTVLAHGRAPPTG